MIKEALSPYKYGVFLYLPSLLSSNLSPSSLSPPLSLFLLLGLSATGYQDDDGERQSGSPLSLSPIPALSAPAPTAKWPPIVFDGFNS